MSSSKPVPLCDYPVYNGTRMLPFPKLVKNLEGEMEKIRNLEITENDILLCAYPKSGTHWLNEIVYMLLNQTVEYSQHPKEDFFLELADFSTLPNQKPYRVLNTHVRFQHLPKHLLRNGGKILHITRNPKDVLVSFFHHSMKSKTLIGLPKSWPEFFKLSCSSELDLYGGWFDYEIEWEIAQQQHPDFNILSLYYEDLKQNLVLEIQKIGKFLEIQISDSFIQQIAHKCHSSNMSTGKNDHSSEFSVDKTAFMYRKGEISDWKNWFTVSQNEIFDKIYSDKMKNSNLKITF